MKKLSLLLLVATGVAYAADGELGLSGGIIAMGDGVVKIAWSRANERAEGPLTGTVPDFYSYLKRKGYAHLMQKDPAAVKIAVELVASITSEESADETKGDDVKAAISSFKDALRVQQDASATIETKIEAWKNELKAYSIALINILRKDLPEGLAIHPLTTERILLNNGKVFDEEVLTRLKAGTLAVLAGFERRKNAMGGEQFKQFCDGQLLDSPAYHVIASIAPAETK